MRPGLILVFANQTLDDTVDDPGDAESRWRRGARGAVQRVRRKSRVQKQHSYDEDVKPGVGPAGGQGGVSSTLTTEGQGNFLGIFYKKNYFRLYYILKKIYVQFFFYDDNLPTYVIINYIVFIVNILNSIECSFNN